MQNGTEPQARARRVTMAVAILSGLVIAILPALVALHLVTRQLGFEANVEFGKAVERLQQLLAKDDLESVRPILGGLLFDEHHDLLDHSYASEFKRVTATDGTVLVEIGNAGLHGMTLRLSGPIMVNGVEVARLDTGHSRWPGLQRVISVLVGSAVLGLLAGWVLWHLPLRLMQNAVSRATELASHDALTGLANRSLFARVLTGARMTNDGACVILIDLDRFKAVNDTFGHARGDAVLLETTRRMRAVLTGLAAHDPLLARQGGDEFALLLVPPPAPDVLDRLARDLIASLSAPITFGGQDVRIGATLGIATTPPGRPAGALLVEADLALYAAKRERRGSHRHFQPEMRTAHEADRQIETALARALADDRLDLHYQPQFDLTTGRITGVEALMRWTDPVLGPVGPDRFIPLAEETGLILQLGRWALMRACTDAVRWDGVKVAVNISPAQFRTGDLVAVVSEALTASSLPPARLELEMTEGILLEDTDSVLETLADLRMMGISIAMDDFGTGYSSLAYLRRFQFDKIKIDRTFVADLGQSPGAESLVNAMIAIGRSLGITATAEGVESAEQVAHLVSRGCQEGQGYLFARPQSREAIDSLLAGGSASQAA